MFRHGHSKDHRPDLPQFKVMLAAVDYEITRNQEAMLANQQKMEWEECLLMVYSPSLARKRRRGLSQRLDKAEQAILALTPPKGRGKRQKKDLTALESSVGSILKQYRVEGLVEVSYTCEEKRRRIRKYKDRPARIEKSIRYVAQVQREDHVCGMAPLLSLALRALTLVEHVVRKELKSAGETLSGLYAGNPKRQTARPTTERLLKAFGSIYLSVVHLPNQVIRHVTPLSELQKRILVLLGIEPAIYEGLMPFVDTG